MIVTDRDQRVLQALARYYLLDRRRVQKLAFPGDKDGRVTRRRLEALANAGYIRRHSMLVASSQDGPLAPVFLLTSKGCEYLAEKAGDNTYLYKPVDLPHALQLVHALAVADFHIMFDTAVAAQSEIVLEAWYNEADVVNASEPDATKHFRLRTKFDNKITCLPDAAFLLNHEGRRAAYYVELERGDGNRGTGSRQLVERKAPGYMELARQQIYLKHFPDSDGFRVLLVVPNERRRDAVRRAFQKKDAAEIRTDLWRFVAHTDIKLDTLFNKEICYRCDEQPPELLVGTGGVRAGAVKPDALDGPLGGESLNAAAADADPTALLAGAAPAAGDHTVAEIPASTYPDTRD